MQFSDCNSRPPVTQLPQHFNIHRCDLQSSLNQLYLSLSCIFNKKINGYFSCSLIIKQGLLVAINTFCYPLIYNYIFYMSTVINTDGFYGLLLYDFTASHFNNIIWISILFHISVCLGFSVRSAVHLSFSNLTVCFCLPHLVSWLNCKSRKQVCCLIINFSYCVSHITCLVPFLYMLCQSHCPTALQQNAEDVLI